MIGSGATNSRHFVRGAPLLGVLLALVLLRTDRVVEAALPGEIARLAPAGALVLLESEDLPGLVGRWRDCRLRTDVEATNVYHRCQASRVVQRLGERLDLFEAVLDGGDLSLDRLAALPGDRGAIALYNVSQTTFVLWLRTHRGAGEELEVLRPDLEVERLERSGQRYLVHHGTDESSTVAFAVVGDLMIVSNDVERFEQAVALALGEGGDALADRGWEAMARQAPASAQVHLSLDMSRLVNTRQFRRYWVHDNADDLEGIDRALLSVTFLDDRVIEHRLLSYRPDGGDRLPAGAERGGTADERLAALPEGIFSALRRVDAAGAVEAARWVWPGGQGELDTLQGLLAQGQPSQVLEVLRPRMGRHGFEPNDQLAVALRLGHPAGVPNQELLAAAAGAMARAVNVENLPTPRRLHRRGVTVYTLSPLLPGGARLSVARSRDGDVLVLSDSPRLAAAVGVAARASAPLGQALSAGGPDVSRVDFDQAQELLSHRLPLITSRGNSRGSGTTFLGRDVPELLGVPRISRIERIAQRLGDLDRQVVRYVE